MIENEKKHGFMDTIKSGLSHVSNVISASVVPTITEGAEKVMKNIDNRIILIEKRIFRKMSSLIILGFGGVFLILALLFFLIDYLGWSKAVAFFSIGIIVFVVGLLLKINESDNKK
jgi:VIT1/CCC1 family predicted Fe2+/Mn2+ transporter